MCGVSYGVMCGYGVCGTGDPNISGDKGIGDRGDPNVGTDKRIWAPRDPTVASENGIEGLWGPQHSDKGVWELGGPQHQWGLRDLGTMGPRIGSWATEDPKISYNKGIGVLGAPISVGIKGFGKQGIPMLYGIWALGEAHISSWDLGTGRPQHQCG